MNKTRVRNYVMFQVVVGGINFDLSVTFDKKHANAKVSVSFINRNASIRPTAILNYSLSTSLKTFLRFFIFIKKLVFNVLTLLIKTFIIVPCQFTNNVLKILGER